MRQYGTDPATTPLIWVSLDSHVAGIVILIILPLVLMPYDRREVGEFPFERTVTPPQQTERERERYGETTSRT